MIKDSLIFYYFIRITVAHYRNILKQNLQAWKSSDSENFIIIYEELMAGSAISSFCLYVITLLLIYPLIDCKSRLNRNIFKIWTANDLHWQETLKCMWGVSHSTITHILDQNNATFQVVLIGILVPGQT